MLQNIVDNVDLAGFAYETLANSMQIVYSGCRKMMQQNGSERWKGFNHE